MLADSSFTCPNAGGNRRLGRGGCLSRDSSGWRCSSEGWQDHPASHALPRCPGYAASDMQWLTPFPGRAWQWGYFPPESEEDGALRSGDDAFQVMWAGRMLRWKRVDTLIRAFAIVAAQAPGARLLLVGHGPEEKPLRALKVAADCALGEAITFSPSASPRDVRSMMRNAHVMSSQAMGTKAGERWSTKRCQKDAPSLPVKPPA